MTHEVAVLCNCDDPELCRTEIYVSDVRIVAKALRGLVDEVAQAEHWLRHTEAFDRAAALAGAA